MSVTRIIRHRKRRRSLVGRLWLGFLLAAAPHLAAPAPLRLPKWKKFKKKYDRCGMLLKLAAVIRRKRSLVGWL